MNVVLNFKQTKELEKDDIIVYQNGHWTNVRKSEFLHRYFKQIEECQANVDALHKEHERLVKAVNDKLEEYHNILQVLIKEE